jgi:hypothetical protein
MGCASYFIHRLPRKGPEQQQQVLHGVIGELNDEIKKKKAEVEEKKCCFIKKMHCVTYQSKRRQYFIN